MPLLGPFKELINCSDLSTCFQSIYNLLFVLLVILAFFNFFFGAFEYLFSGANIFQAGKGKDRMKNALGAIIIVLIISQILNYINPNIFKVKWSLPEIKKLKN